MDKVEKDTDEEFVEETTAHMKMELTSHISPVNLKIQIWTYSQLIKGKGSLRTRYAQNYWRKKKRHTTSFLSAEKDNKNLSSIILSLGFKTVSEINLDWQEE